MRTRYWLAVTTGPDHKEKDTYPVRPHGTAVNGELLKRFAANLSCQPQ